MKTNNSTLQRPPEISCWAWYDKQHHTDLTLWQNCIKAALGAGSEDVNETAEKMYDHHGGERLAGISRRNRKRATK